MKTRNWIIAVTGAALFALAILVLRPVPVPDEKDCVSIQGTVARIYKAGTNDVVFMLWDHDTRYYINRGLERGLELEKLTAGLIDREVTIKYPKYWTPLDPGNSVRHITKIETAGHTWFSEID